MLTRVTIFGWVSPQTERPGWLPMSVGHSSSEVIFGRGSPGLEEPASSRSPPRGMSVSPRRRLAHARPPLASSSEARPAHPTQTQEQLRVPQRSEAWCLDPDSPPEGT